jgi:hypothetical protein
VLVCNQEESWNESTDGSQKAPKNLRAGEVATCVSEALKSRSHAVREEVNLQRTAFYFSSWTKCRKV